MDSKETAPRIDLHPAAESAASTGSRMPAVRASLVVSSDRQNRMTATWAAKGDVVSKSIAQNILALSANAFEVCDRCHVFSVCF
jgi:hypothetical protein